MDLSELNLGQAAEKTGPSGPTDAGDATHPEGLRWRDILATLSAETSGPLTAALERVETLATTGRIDRAGLRTLVDEIRHARQAGLVGQQLTRLASGRLRQSHERLRLADVLKDVLTQHARETEARGLLVQQVLQPSEVLVDPTLLFSLFEALLAWSLAHARASIEFRSDVKSWPAHARVITRFACRLADERPDAATEATQRAALDTLSWRLLEQTAWAMGLPLDRRCDGPNVVVTLEFPRTINDQVEGVTAVELDQGFSPSVHPRSLAGHQVLVVASRRDVRAQVRDAIRNMGMIVDYVSSVDEARQFCRSGVPHAIVIESVLRGDRFNALRRECEGSGADVVFIEIIEEGHMFEISGFGGISMARVGRDAIAASLPSALLFELSRTSA